MKDAIYRTKLQHKAAELRESLRRRGDIAVQRAADDLDETLLAAEREYATAGLQRTYSLLRQVEAAILKLERAEFGVCGKCECDIPDKRLQAIPWALYCVSCQEEEDRLSEGAEEWTPAA